MGKRKVDKMAKQMHVNGYEAFNLAVQENKDKLIFALFSGTVDENGKNWCPDCVKADPVVERCLSKLDKDAVFIHCGVGDRTFWKDQQNVFRTDQVLKLKSVPTLMKVGQPERLQEEQCANEDLVTMLFEDN